MNGEAGKVAHRDFGKGLLVKSAFDIFIANAGNAV